MITFNPPSGRWLAAVATAILFVSQSAHATFGGDDGAVAYSDQNAIFTIDGRQLTVPVPGSGEQDLHPVYSPDGKQIAFIVKRNFVHDSVDIMLADGTQRHTVFTADTIAPTAGLYSLTWLRNNHQLALSVVNVVGGSYATGGLWLMESDGSAPAQIVMNGDSAEQTIFEVDGSPTDDAVLYRCRYRTLAVRLRDDFCIADTSGGVQRLPIDVPNVASSTLLGAPQFAPDGQSLVFTAQYSVTGEEFDYSFPLPWDPSQPLCSGRVGLQHYEIFKIKRDGTALHQITRAVPVRYFAYSDATGATCGVGASQTFNSAAMSPRGDQILAFGAQQYANASSTSGLFQVDPEGFATLVQPFGFSPQPFANWQPKPQAPGISIVDGHGNLLDGLKIELRRRSDGTVVDNRAINSGNGRYVFENPLPPGDYDLRATLIDNCGTDACTPMFDIRYSPEPADPVRIDWHITITAGAQDILLDFDSIDSTVFDSNISKSAWDRLDDMADIYYQLRRYAYWAKGRFNLGTIPTVRLYAFAILDPIETTETVASLGDVYYRPGDDAIVVDVLSSEYENRNGAADGIHDGDAPQNVEWHEFTHHLHYTFVTQDPCAGEKSHGGYNNKDTCDSLDEGLAAFLPTVALLELDGGPIGRYDHFTNLEFNLKAWDRSSGGHANEDLAVAALLWDLTDSGYPAAADSDFALILGSDGQQHIKQLSEFVTMPVVDLWNLLAANHLKNVRELRAALGQQTPLIDLDGDGVNDVSLIDVPFIMHGFYPVDTNLPMNPNLFAFDVARPSAVGDSSHRVFDSSGALDRTLIPRPNIPHDPRSWLGIAVLDNSGNPIPGATLHLAYRYPNGSLDTVDLRLTSGSSRVYVDLPQYFKYLLPDDAPLPACDPASDAHADVTLTAEFNGTASSDSAVIDNCAWAHAVAASTGSTALSYTLHVPVAGGTPIQHTLTLSVAGTGSGSVFGAGTYVEGSVAAVSAIAAADSTFDGWAGPNAAECANGAVTMTADKSCTATMTLKQVAQVQVPNVIGLTQSAASSAISAVGLMLGTSTPQSSTTIAAGNVIAENPAAGTSVTLQSAVNLVVATNPLVCDANNDKRIDARDIAAILLAWTKHANGAYDPRDADRNGVINARDTAKCLTMCTSFLCSVK